MRFRVGIAGITAIAAALTLVPLAPAARGHVLEATYTGHGSGAASGTRVAGRATATGRGTVIGRSTLSGSGAGTLTATGCLSINGKAVLKGAAGSIRLTANAARACLPASGATSVSFSGRVRVTGGTARFAGAHGTLRFHGVYNTQTRVLTITFKGTVTY